MVKWDDPQEPFDPEEFKRLMLDLLRKSLRDPSITLPRATQTLPTTSAVRRSRITVKSLPIVVIPISQAHTTYMANHIKIESSNHRVTVVKISCPMHKGTAEPHLLELPSDKLEAWASGRVMVQDAFPDMSVDDRERLISGICPACFKQLFGEE